MFLVNMGSPPTDPPLFRIPRMHRFLLALTIVLGQTLLVIADDKPSQPQLYRASIKPHWLSDRPCFWYRNGLANGAREFVLVDAQKGTREPALDHERLAAALSEQLGEEVAATHLPIDALEFVGDESIRLHSPKAVWRLQ